MQKDIKRKTIQATKWAAVSEILTKLVSPLVNIVLARLLAPEVFGLVATFTLVTTFAEVFTDAGVQKYLIQHEFKDKEEREQYTNVAFWTNLIVSVLIWLGIALFKNRIAEFIGSPGYGFEVAVLSLQIPLHALASIQRALYQRDLRFKQLVPIKFAESMVPLCVTVPLAYFLKNEWAIIIGNLLKIIVGAGLLTLFSNWKPRFYFSILQLKNMYVECLWLLGDSIMIWLTSYASIFIVNRYLSPYYIGIYKVGTTTVTPYIGLVFTITSPVLFSVLSRLQNDQKAFDQVYLSYQKYASYLMIPVGAALFIYREAVTLILLGNDWLETVPLIGYVGLSASISTFTAQYNSVYFRAKGRADIAMTVQGTYVAIKIAVILWAAKQPFSTLCIVAGNVNYIYCFISMAVMLLVYQIRPFMVFKNLLPALWGLVFFVPVACYTRNLLTNVVLSSIISGCIAIAAYSLGLLMIPSTRNTVVEMIKRKKY